MNRTVEGLILIIALSLVSVRTLHAENAPKYPDGETATEQGTKQLYRNYIMIIEVDGKKATHWLLHKNGKFKLGEVSLEPFPRRSK